MKKYKGLVLTYEDDGRGAGLVPGSSTAWGVVGTIFTAFFLVAAFVDNLWFLIPAGVFLLFTLGILDQGVAERKAGHPL